MEDALTRGMSNLHPRMSPKEITAGPMWGLSILIVVFIPIAVYFVYLLKTGMVGGLDVNWDSLDNTPKNQLEFNFSTSPIEIPTVAGVPTVPLKKLKSEGSFDEDLDCSVVDLDDFEERES